MDKVKRLLPWLVAVAFFMESLDDDHPEHWRVPAVAEALHVALASGAACSSHTLSLAVFILVSGWPQTACTRRVFSAAIVLFTLGPSSPWALQQHPSPSSSPAGSSRCGGADMSRRAAHVVRTSLSGARARDELRRHPRAHRGPMLGPLVEGFIVSVLHWRAIFFVNLLGGLVGLYMVFRHLPDYRAEHSDPLDVVGMVLFGAGVALLSWCRGSRRAHLGVRA